jgi:hypothetical protein
MAPSELQFPFSHWLRFNFLQVIWKRWMFPCYLCCLLQNSPAKHTLYFYSLVKFIGSTLLSLDMITVLEVNTILWYLKIALHIKFLYLDVITKLIHNKESSVFWDIHVMHHSLLISKQHFWRIISPPSSKLKNKAGKRPSWSRWLYLPPT